MNIQRDFEEFLQLLNVEKVEFVVVGGYAVAHYGYIRATNDIDIFFRNTRDNIRRLIRALSAFGIDVDDSMPDSFAEPGRILRLGVPPEEQGCRGPGEGSGRCRRASRGRGYVVS